MTVSAREMSLGQFVKQLAGTLQQQGVELPFKNQRPWHCLFYDLTKVDDPGRPLFLTELIFDWDGPFPRCRELSEFLNALHFTASASARNPRFDTISLAPETVQQWLLQAGDDEPALKAFLASAAERAAPEFHAATGSGPRKAA